jgi:glycosyltransferase involved in cell wall biosynthesis
MKICYVCKGQSLNDEKFLKYLVSRGYDIYVISYFSRKPIYTDGIKLHHIPAPNPLLEFLTGCILTPLLIRKIKPDIVHGNYLLTYGFYSALANYHPLLQMAWGSDIFLAPRQNLIYRSIVKYSLKKADLVTVDCQIGKQVIGDLGYPKEKVNVFPWGIDFKKFNPEIDSKNLRSLLQWEDKIVIICTRKHEPVYGLEYLVKAIPYVISKYDQARFLFVGSGPLTSHLKKMVNDLSIEKYVKFTGWIPNEELPKYLAASDLYVSSSLSDGTSVCLLEALASGLPVVVTDVDAVLEWVTDGENGLVVPKKNPAALAGAICTLLEDNNLREIFGRRNYKIAIDRASWDDNVKILEGMYQSLAKR